MSQPSQMTVQEPTKPLMQPAPVLGRRINLKQRVSCFVARRSGSARLRVRGERVAPRFIVGTELEARKICALDDEEELLVRFLGELRAGDVVYDIGGNIGLYALPSAMKLSELGPGKHGLTGRVYAFEPVPEWCLRLRQNVFENSVPNLDVFDVALADKRGRASFTVKAVAGSGMGSLVEGYDAYLPDGARRTIEVEVARADEFAAKRSLPLPTVLKIDVEGAELAVLQGLGPLLAARCCRFVLVEVHTQFARDGAEVQALLSSSGFEIERGPLRGSEYHLFATRV
jgi:FkbM family methyltransferase